MIPDKVGPLESATIEDVAALDKQLKPYFKDLDKQVASGLNVKTSDFQKTLTDAIIAEGAKEGSSAATGNPVRDRFKKIYGTDENGFVDEAKANFRKSRGEE